MAPSKMAAAMARTESKTRFARRKSDGDLQSIAPNMLKVTKSMLSPKNAAHADLF
jgi:hypothetical protein